ncbi:MAG: DNA polymerase III subunit delta [Gammaproteobacteria bacterium]
MKITNVQLTNQIKNKLSHFYMISGDEILLVEEAVDTIKKAAFEQNYTLERWQADASFDWEKLINHLNTTSLFSNKAIVQLTVSSKISDAGKKMLQAYVDNPAPDKILLMIFGKLTPAELKAKWIVALEQKGTLVQVFPVTREGLPQWIKQRLQKVGFVPNQAVCDLLANYYEGNLLALSAEIAKLRLLFNENNLTVSEVEVVISNQARFDIYILVDSLLAFDMKRSYHILQQLRREGVEPILILWAIAREWRQMTQIAWQIEQGSKIELALQKAGVWTKRQPLVKQALKRGDFKFWQKGLFEAQAIDRLCKGAESGSTWHALERFVGMLKN